MILEYLKKNNLIICPNHLKKQVIQEINSSTTLISYQVMSLEEWRENYFFTYSKKTIYYLMQKLNLKIEIILEYLESLYYIENKHYHSAKLNQLVFIKTELLENHLLFTKPLFLEYLKQVSIILYGYDEIDPFYEKIFQNYDYYKINIQNSEKQLSVYEFDSMEEEIAYICHDIKEKLDLGIPIHNIKLIIAGDEYKDPLKRIFTWCHLPIEIPKKISLYDIPVGKIIIQSIQENQSFSQILEKLEDIEEELQNQIISIFNTYIDLEVEPKDLLEIITYDLKNHYLPYTKQENTIQIVSFSELTQEDYGYVLGFNREHYPTIYKDEEFLNDQEKEDLGLLTSNTKNINSMKSLQNEINMDSHLTISYKMKDFFESYHPCVLVENMKVIKNQKPSYQISNTFNLISLAKEYDKFYQYGIHTNILDVLSNHYLDYHYRSYWNQFTGLDPMLLQSSLKKPFTVSYTSIDTYFKCSFRYYMNHILKIKEENKDEFFMQVGNIFHFVLSKCLEDHFHFEESWNEEAQKYSFSLANLMILEKLKDELQYDIEIIKKQLNWSDLTTSLCEKWYEVPLSNSKNIPTKLVGKIDKVVYHQYGNETLVSIIDYKSGSLLLDLRDIIYGINMQLPVYAYFVKKSTVFENPKIVGFYLQKMINKDVKKSFHQSAKEEKEKALKLFGYSIDNPDYLQKFDHTYSDSQMIQGLKIKNDGNFYHYSKVLTEDQMNHMEKLVDGKLHDAIENILAANFLINPKKIGKDDVECHLCGYRDICFRTEADVIPLEKQKNLDFLGGDENAKLDGRAETSNI